MTGQIYLVVIEKDLRDWILDTTSGSPSDITPFGQQLFGIERGLDSLFFEFDARGRVISYDPSAIPKDFLGIPYGLRNKFAFASNPNFNPKTPIQDISDFIRKEIDTYTQEGYASPRAIVDKEYLSKFRCAAKRAGLELIRIPFPYHEFW